MAMIRCPECGEKYSDTYKSCPFCEEEEALVKEKTIHRSIHGRVSPITIILIVLIVVMAALLIFLLKGGKGTSSKPSSSKPDTTQQEPAVTPIEPSDPVEPSIPVKPETSTPVMPSEPEPTTPAVTTPTTPAATAPGNKDNKLSKTDVTIGGGESFTLKVSGVTTGVTWSSDNEAVAKVSSSGVVTGVAKGSCNIIATWDGQSRSCIVRVKSGTAAAEQPATTPTTTPTTPTTPTTTTPTTTPTTPTTASGSLKLGAGKVANASSGVNVRSGPGTSYERIASLSVGAKVTIAEDAGDGWYRVVFTATGGIATEGYIKGDYLSN